MKHAYRIIGFHVIGYVPDRALILLSEMRGMPAHFGEYYRLRRSSEVPWELFRGRNPFLTDQCAIGNFSIKKLHC